MSAIFDDDLDGDPILGRPDWKGQPPGSCGCGARWFGQRLEHCTVCHRTFSGTTTGDAHRVGPYWPEGLRRCLTDDELTARGLWLDAGIWHGRPNRAGIQHRRP